LDHWSPRDYWLDPADPDDPSKKAVYKKLIILMKYAVPTWGKSSHTLTEQCTLDHLDQTSVYAGLRDPGSRNYLDQ
jgi:hypothetical protein